MDFDKKILHRARTHLCYKCHKYSRWWTHRIVYDNAAQHRENNRCV